MKCALIVADKIKQIMLTADTKEEQAILDMFTINDDITVESKDGTMYDTRPDAAKGYTISVSQGGYLRAYESKQSLMLVLKPKS